MGSGLMGLIWGIFIFIFCYIYKITWANPGVDMLFRLLILYSYADFICDNHHY